MIFYLDTSGLVKLYIREPGSADVRAWVTAADAVRTSWVAYAETRAAFTRALREGATEPRHHAERVGRFNQDWEALLRVHVLPPVARSAGDLSEVYGLRRFDAIHLASALWLPDKVGSAHLTFAAFDRRLQGAAERAGLQTTSPSGVGEPTPPQ